MNILNCMVGFVATTDMEKAREFYASVLGFVEVASDEYGVMFAANGAYVRVTRSASFRPAPGTVLGWKVPDMKLAVAALRERGVKFEQFNLSFMQQDALGIWVAPNGDEVAWFRDPEGNVLSISKHVFDS